MFIRIHHPKKTQSGNSGSCNSLINYLEKENEQDDMGLENQEYFFTHDSDMVSSNEVINRIDKNVAKLSKKEARFYMISINPSAKEQQFLAQKVTGRKINSPEELTNIERKQFDQELKEYSKNVMDSYAQNFNKGLDGKDIVYFGKVEHERKYSRHDDIVKSGDKKAGELKNGFQAHVHIVVSRKDATNKIRLSPFANHKNSKNVLNGAKVQIGFDRKKFVEEGERKFDSQFNYQRHIKDSFQYRHTMKNGMASIGRSFANQLSGGMYMKVYGAKMNYENMKEDPLKVLSSMMHKNTAFRNASKIAQMGAQPQKIVVEAVKKIPQVITKSATIKM